MERQTMILAVALVVVIGQVTGTTYSQCGLANLLKSHGFSDIANWVCLVESESSGNTAARGGPNTDGSYDYGLFQINSRYWCGLNGAGGDCNVACNSLLDNDISNDAACAKKIYGQMGFWAWYGWQRSCNNKALPDVSRC